MKLVFTSTGATLEVPDEYAQLVMKDDRFTQETQPGVTWKVRYRSWKIPKNVSEGMTLFVYLDKVLV